MTLKCLWLMNNNKIGSYNVIFMDIVFFPFSFKIVLLCFKVNHPKAKLVIKHAADFNQIISDHIKSSKFSVFVCSNKITCNSACVALNVY